MNILPEFLMHVKILDKKGDNMGFWRTEHLYMIEDQFPAWKKNSNELL